MKERYEKLYDYMAKSGNPKNMVLFGSVMSEMMDRAIKNDPSFAEKEIDKLEAMMWQQYLSKSEAQNIVEHMSPSAPWSYPTWENAMQQAGLPIMEDGIYNCYALWVEMNKLMSDHAETFKKYGVEPDLSMIHDLAIDNLKDKDGVYNIREYFKV